MLYIKGPLPDPVHECVRCAFGNDASLVEKDNPIGKKFRFFNVVRRQQDGCAFLLDAFDQAPEFSADERIKSYRGFVQKEDAGLCTKARASMIRRFSPPESVFVSTSTLCSISTTSSNWCPFLSLGCVHAEKASVNVQIFPY